MKKDAMANDPARNDRLILTDINDRSIGTATKEQAHRQGLLHRAFSVLLFRETETGREYLLSKRAAEKYHSAGLWANSCCSHPREGETVLSAAENRVSEELGCTAKGLAEIGRFVYRAAFPNGLIEYESDHVLIGRFTGILQPDPSEVSETRWVTAEEMNGLLVKTPELFAPWAFTVLSTALSYEAKMHGDLA